MINIKVFQKTMLASVVCLGLAACGSSSDPNSSIIPTPKPTPSGDYQDMLQAAVDSGVPGVVMAIESPEINFIGAAGVADLDTLEPMQTYHQMPTGSSGKKATALLVAMLHEEGMLDMDYPISTWLPSTILSRIENSESMTLRQLLNHTAGLWDYLDDGSSDKWFEAIIDNPTSVKTDIFALQFALDQPAYFAPGEAFNYSNTGYLLAGLILDEILGEHHHNAMRERLFIGLGMNNTYYNGLEKDMGSIISGYAEFDDEIENTKFIYENIGVADAPLVSTVEDMSILLRAIVSENSSLDSEVTDHLFANNRLVQVNSETQYGLGIFYQKINGKDVYHHGGGDPGYITENYYVADSDLTLTVFFNCSGYQACQAPAANFMNNVLATIFEDN
ncbi:beta-lactamase family protein [Glaciecola sp. XM2]|uniref:serine hydrolase domain-containing protein n=1 Tax=Glaciecola sp. XM2 TaxID=1914931 RepID=UPI001BDEA0DC|nr:serine hydrolase domain-containing protein [Glaciecola sp. XM2]MBT1450271.1 beta-lactamase family protein [Glaciecola sp. XM2]